MSLLVLLLDSPLRLQLSALYGKEGRRLVVIRRLLASLFAFGTDLLFINSNWLLSVAGGPDRLLLGRLALRRMRQEEGAKEEEEGAGKQSCFANFDCFMGGMLFVSMLA